MSVSTCHPLPFLPTEVVSKIMAELEIQELVACQGVSTSSRCESAFAEPGGVLRHLAVCTR